MIEDRQHLHNTGYVKATAPTFNEALTVHGKNKMSAWLIFQINALNEITGTRDKMSDLQLRYATDILMERLARCNCAEFIQFFYYLSSGKLGEYYGCLAPEKIGSKADRYLLVLQEEREQIDREQGIAERARKEAEMAKALQESNRLMGENKIAWAKAELERRRKLQETKTNVV